MHVPTHTRAHIRRQENARCPFSAAHVNAHIRPEIKPKTIITHFWHASKCILTHSLSHTHTVILSDCRIVECESIKSKTLPLFSALKTHTISLCSAFYNTLHGSCFTSIAPVFTAKCNYSFFLKHSLSHIQIHTLPKTNFMWPPIHLPHKKKM